MERALVLDAMGIDYSVQREWWGWCLIVEEEVEKEARLQLDLYEQEQYPQPSLPDAPSPPQGAELGVFAYFTILLSMFYLQGSYGFGIDWTAAGRVDVAVVLGGEYWRTVTALTLHRDFWHLLGNLAFGTIFGVMVSRLVGPGLAWLAILAAGASGNGLNVLVQPPGHLSIGASTAVFAAVGLLASCSFLVGRLHRDTWARRWAPIVGGLWVLTWLGTGDAQTDVVAHLTGFIAGLLFGIALSWLHVRRQNSPALQWAAGLFGIAAVAGSWASAI